MLESDACLNATLIQAAATVTKKTEASVGNYLDKT